MTVAEFPQTSPASKKFIAAVETMPRLVGKA